MINRFATGPSEGTERRGSLVGMPSLIRLKDGSRKELRALNELFKVCGTLDENVRKRAAVSLDFSKTSFFDAHLCAMLGAVSFLDESYKINILNCRKSVEAIMRRNGFADTVRGADGSYSGSGETALPYRHFHTTKENEKSFADYLDSYLFSRSDLPDMSPMLKGEVKKSLFEVWANVKLHAGFPHLFVCGQYFPQEGHLEFVLANRGRTIPQNVNDYCLSLKNRFLSKAPPAYQCMEWALEDGHSTRGRGAGGPGGLGLTIIREFVDRNKGTIHIISGGGYYRRKGGEDFFDKGVLEAEFPGTAVIMSVNMKDDRSYAMVGERGDIEF